MLKILNKSEKSTLIKSLNKLIKNYWNKNNYEQYWHAQRMENSLKFELSPQQVYVDQFPNYSYIINKYHNKNSGYLLELFTIDEENELILQDITRNAVKMIFEPSWNYAQIQSSPLYLHQYLYDAVIDEGIYIIEDIAANCMVFPAGNYEQLLKNIQPIKGFRCGKMSIDDAELVNKRFKYANSEHTLKWIEKSISTLPNIGCWEEKTGKLVGQFIVMESGNTGGLFVVDECKGLKLGKWIVQEMTKLQVESNFPIVLETEFSNRISYSLFTSLGFETIAQSYYMLFHRDPEIKVEF